MRVLKRNNTLEEVSFDKVITRIQKLCNIEPKCVNIDAILIAQKVCARIYDGVKTTELDELAAQITIALCTTHLEYGTLAGRIIISNNHKNTTSSFSEAASTLYNEQDAVSGKLKGLISKSMFDVIQQNKERLNAVIDHQRDYDFDFFAFKTLEKAYLMKANGKIVERIQYMLMRVALGIHGEDIEDAINTYELMSSKAFIHATPTLFHSGCEYPQLLSCFLLGTDDSVDGIYKTIADCAMISKWAGGIGVHVSNIRSNNTVIRGTHGKTSGIVPMLRVYNETARYINQSGRRNGSFAVYLSPWHDDIFEFMDLRKNHGDENARARDLFYAMWISDLFMIKVKLDEDWYTFNPDDCRDLDNTFGAEFEAAFNRYVKEGKYVRKMKARSIWMEILKSQMETGTPYMLYKDACNEKSNQKNLGVIKSSNLCAEIIEYSDKEEYACCTLASVGLPSFVKPRTFARKITMYSKSNCSYCDVARLFMNDSHVNFDKKVLDEDYTIEELRNVINSKRQVPVGPISFPQIFVGETHVGGFNELVQLVRPVFDFEALRKTVHTVTKNLNKVIDLNYYPVAETEVSNKRHRPIGIGVQGLADVYSKMRMPFDSNEARQLNKEIFATIYYAAVETSCELAKEQGKYSTYENSPMSQGKFQFDLWNTEPLGEVGHVQNYEGDVSTRLKLDWDTLRSSVKEHGQRNSLLVALMPTASTSQILGNNECIEPYTSTIYVRRTMAGDFVVVNKHLIADLCALGLWDEEMKNRIVMENGSIQNIDTIPIFLRNLYKVVWDLSQKTLIDQAVDRGIYVCQSQSLNLFVEKPTAQNMSSMHFYAWSKGLKTGMYYLRTRAAAKAQQFTVDPRLYQKYAKKEEVCESCSG